MLVVTAHLSSSAVALVALCCGAFWDEVEEGLKSSAQSAIAVAPSARGSIRTQIFTADLPGIAGRIVRSVNAAPNDKRLTPASPAAWRAAEREVAHSAGHAEAGCVVEAFTVPRERTAR
jgi:hypothetical protein